MGQTEQQESSQAGQAPLERIPKEAVERPIPREKVEAPMPKETTESALMEQSTMEPVRTECRRARSEGRRDPENRASRWVCASLRSA
jgi:hypothetical protein